MEEAVLSTLEGLVEVVENREEPSVFRQGEQDTLIILGIDSGTWGRGEGRWGGGGRDEPTNSEPEPLDYEEEEEDKEEEDMADQNLEWWLRDH